MGRPRVDDVSRPVGTVGPVAGLLGLTLVGSDGDVLALNHSANLLHLLTAAVAMWAAWVSTRRLETT